MRRILSALEAVRLIEEYCTMYGEWPKQKNNNKTKDGTTSAQLISWLYTSGYMTGNFKYINQVDEKGNNIKKRLDKIRQQVCYKNPRNDELKIKLVDLIEEYCDTYKEWPKTGNYHKKTKDGTTSDKLANWLNRSGYFIGEFKYAKVLDKQGISLQEKLDNLYKQYDYSKPQEDENKIKMVDLIEEYCKIYGEWPKASNYDKKTTDGTASHYLRYWLYASGYTTGNFKYTNILDKNGNSIKERLDDLYQQYGHINRQGAESKIRMVNLLEEYCETYNDWPKFNDVDTKTKDGTTASQLAYWLDQSGYSRVEFKYANITDENGNSIKQRLDYLHGRYGRQNRRKVKMVELIEEYCETYHEWPKSNNKHHKVKNGKTAKYLSNWLYVSGYMTGKFKFTQIVDKNGISLKEKLDCLFQKYGYLSCQSDEYKIKMVNLIEEYCETYGEWPKHNNKDNITRDGTTSSKLASWLNTSGYFDDVFKYGNIVDENGQTLKERLDYLYQQYSFPNQRSINAKINIVNLIESYCKKYGEWPRYFSEDQLTEKEIASNQLARWLASSGYMTKKFKYGDIVNENGINIQDKLDALFMIFAGNNSTTNDDRNTNLNLWSVKDSGDLGISFYYLVIQLKNAYDNQNKENFEYYKQLLQSKLTNHFIKLDIENLIKCFELTKEERISFYYIQWKTAAIQNNQDLVILFSKLYEYEKSSCINQNKVYKKIKI